MPEETKEKPRKLRGKKDAGGKENAFFYDVRFARTFLRSFELTSESMKTIEMGPRNLATGNICEICNDSEIYAEYIMTGGLSDDTAPDSYTSLHPGISR